MFSIYEIVRNTTSEEHCAILLIQSEDTLRQMEASFFVSLFLEIWRILFLLFFFFLIFHAIAQAYN